MNPWSLYAIAFLLAGPGSAPPEAGVEATQWNFDIDEPDGEPAGFHFSRTGSGRPGRWVVRTEKDAPSPPNVLAQVDADPTDYRFPVAVAAGSAFRDLRLSVRCKPVSGKIDRACGVVFRYVDEGNYYIARANSLEGNVRLYAVQGGRRRQLASFTGPVGGDAWHRLGIEVEGKRIRVFWEGEQVLAVEDASFEGPGRVGLWTKADSVTYFDDLTVAPLDLDPGPPPRRGESP